MSTEQPDTGEQDAPENKPDTTDVEGSDTDTAEVDKWKAMARKHEERATANAEAAKELAELRKTSMTDQERAVAEATEALEARIRSEYGSKLASAEIKAAAVGLPIDIEALLESVDSSRFLNDEGAVDTTAIRSWLDRLAPPRTDSGPPAVPDLGQGVRTRGDYPLGGDQLLADLKAKVGI